MTKTICDICGKDMTVNVFTEPITEFNFRISTHGVKWDVCNECRDEFNKWVKERYIRNTLFAENSDKAEK